MQIKENTEKLNTLIEKISDLPEDSLRQFIEGTLTSYSNKEIEKVRAYVFYQCTQLKEIDLPNCTNINNYAFQYCSDLEEINFPSLKTIGSYGFSRCTNLQVADFGSLEAINGYAFQLCGNLTQLIIRTPTVCELRALSAINSTAIHNKKGYIYVPDELVEEYKVATNWSNYASQIKPLSEYQE